MRPEITYKKGFTLIELLVVMTIVSILMGVSAVGFIGSRKGARDTQRKADLQKISSAYEAFRSDCGHYPARGVAPTYIQSPTNGDGAAGSACPPTATYLASPIPTDPISTLNYIYVITGTVGTPPVASSYALCAFLENNPSTPIPNCNIPCGTYNGGAVNCNYEVDSF